MFFTTEFVIIEFVITEFDYTSFRNLRVYRDYFRNLVVSWAKKRLRAITLEQGGTYGLRATSGRQKFSLFRLFDWHLALETRIKAHFGPRTKVVARPSLKVIGLPRIVDQLSRRDVNGWLLSSFVTHGPRGVDDTPVGWPGDAVVSPPLVPVGQTWTH